VRNYIIGACTRVKPSKAAITKTQIDGWTRTLELPLGVRLADRRWARRSQGCREADPGGDDVSGV
jgi:hypothetical protein